MLKSAVLHLWGLRTPGDCTVWHDGQQKEDACFSNELFSQTWLWPSLSIYGGQRHHLVWKSRLCIPGETIIIWCYLSRMVQCLEQDEAARCRECYSLPTDRSLCLHGGLSDYMGNSSPHHYTSCNWSIIAGTCCTLLSWDIAAAPHYVQATEAESQRHLTANPDQPVAWVDRGIEWWNEQQYQDHAAVYHWAPCAKWCRSWCGKGIQENQTVYAFHCSPPWYPLSW